MYHRFTRALAVATAAAITLFPASPVFAGNNDHGNTSTPIKHLVIIFQENVSFDHYFGTYPNATNPKGEPQFHAKPGTPTVNGLTGVLLTANPNGLGTANGTGTSNPFRLDRTQAATADQNHSYGPEQAAVHFGLMDLFPSKVGTAGPPPNAPPQIVTTKGLTMGYYDGNTVTALWNYAQHYAMSDNSYGTTFGPSTPGLLNLVAGQTNGVDQVLNPSSSFETDGGNGTLTVISDPDPFGDACSNPNRNQVQMAGQNIGDLLNQAGVTWGSFMGGFDLTVTNSNGTTGCSRSTDGVSGTTADYIAHHAFFQYWKSTANPAHVRPASTSEIGYSGPANHNYDISDFYTAIKHGNIPAVSFIKAPAYQDGHAGYSNPIDEQTFIVNLINKLQQSSEWSSTAVVIAYDDSDGWYDHQMSPIVNQSTSPADALTAVGACGDGSNALPGPESNPHAQGRCGYGPRLPLMVISAWAKRNYVDHTVTDQSSVLRFIEDNWLDGQRIGDGSYDSIANPIDNMFDFDGFRFGCKFILDPSTGQPVGLDRDWF
ncbi:MAG TPA: alkaline phosphatase family protein [Candidatus Eisenbacteria bacterium]|nr:alkaline phosphatase family protein [Candidatus Eisenbacteria bacterium]